MLKQTELTELLKKHYNNSVKNFDAIENINGDDYLGDTDNNFRCSINFLSFIVEPSTNNFKMFNGGNYRTTLYAEQKENIVTVYLDSTSEFEDTEIVFEGKANLKLAIASLLISI